MRDGAIGDLLLGGQRSRRTCREGDIRRVRALGGGSDLDLGCYCVSALRVFGGEPQRVNAEAVYDDDGVDLRMVASLRLENGVLGQLDVGLHAHPSRRARAGGLDRARCSCPTRGSG